MSRQEIDAYFAQIPEWMKNDVHREIALARATHRGEKDEQIRKVLEELDLVGGGNVLTKPRRPMSARPHTL